MKKILFLFICLVVLIMLFAQHHLSDMAVYPHQLIHILLAAGAFAVVCTAALLSVLLSVQDYLLRHQYAHGLFSRLPPIEVMERLLFHILWLGFFLLSAVLISGFYLFEHWLSPPLVHKVWLTFVTWLIFAILLYGRYFSGWRGRKVVYYTLTGFFLLIIIYFASLSVMEHIP